MSSDLKEYVVTVKDKKDLDSLYEDIEKLSHGNSCIPDRMVTCCKRRKISRNTHYLLTAEEAEKLKKDERVKRVSLSPDELGLVVQPMSVQSSDFWNKSNTNDPEHKNWGLLRCVLGEQLPNWGTDDNPNQSGTINLTSSGKNVDVVIVDGHFDPDHPEFKENSDGSGPTRVVQYNWLQHNPEINEEPAGTYTYTPYDNPLSENNHGAHVAGTVAGNTQGWARSANIYNISPYSNNPNNIAPLELIDYIREFHKNKPINPVTGRKNPTITNHSWGYSYGHVNFSDITHISYRGNLIEGPFNAEALKSFGVIPFLPFPLTVSAPARFPALDEDIEDAIEDGIIFIGAAGNSGYKADVPGGIDYDNYFIVNSTSAYFYHEGSSPGSAANVVCVGSSNTTVEEKKVDFSVSGPRVDVYAPGVNIMSSFISGGVPDPRDPNYFISKDTGTSMASPQVCGIITCLLEQYPHLDQQAVRDYLASYSKYDQLYDDPNSTHEDLSVLQGSENRYLFYYKERPDSGITTPKLNYQKRPAQGTTYPRKIIKYYVK